MAIPTPFRTEDCTERELSRPEIERFLFRIAAEMDQSLASSQRPAAYLDGVTQSIPFSADRAVQRAVQRARWLAEVASALDHATALTLDLCDYAADGKEAGALRGRISSLRDEVDSIRKGQRPDSQEIRPQWM